MLRLVLCWSRYYMSIKIHYKHLSLVWGADRQICLRSLGFLVMPNDAKQWSQGTDFYIRTKQPWYFFSCIPKGFWSPAFDFNIGVPIKQSHSYTLTSAILKFDVCEVTMMSTPNVLTAELRDLLYNQCIGNTCWSSIFIYPTGRIRVCKIRFVWQHWWKSQKNFSGVQEMSINVSAVMYLDWHTVCQSIYDILYSNEDTICGSSVVPD